VADTGRAFDTQTPAIGGERRGLHSAPRRQRRHEHDPPGQM